MGNWWQRFVISPMQITLSETSWFGFVFSAFLIGAIVNLATGVFQELAGVAWTVVLLILILLVTWIFINLYTRSVRRRLARGARVIEDRPSPPKQKGLIVMITPAPTARVAVDYHLAELKHLWLIVTPQMAETGQTLQNYAESNGVECHSLDLKDEYDAQSCYYLVRDVYERYAARSGLKSEEIAADITGGTKPMTAAMVLACSDLGLNVLEHVPTRFLAGSQPTDPFQPIAIAINT